MNTGEMVALTVGVVFFIGVMAFMDQTEPKSDAKDEVSLHIRFLDKKNPKAIR